LGYRKAVALGKIPSMQTSSVSHAHASVSASITLAVLHAAVRLGLEREALLVSCGLTEEQLADPDARVPFTIQEHLWQLLSSSLPLAEPGLAIGVNLAPGPFSVLGYLLQSSQTLNDALNAGMRYQRLVGEGGEMHMQELAEGLQILY